MFNWSEVPLYRSNFLQNPYFSAKIILFFLYISEFECGSFDLQQMEGRCVVQNEAELQLKRKSILYSIEENFIKSNNDTEKCPPGSKDYNRLVFFN